MRAVAVLAPLLVATACRSHAPPPAREVVDPILGALSSDTAPTDDDLASLLRYARSIAIDSTRSAPPNRALVVAGRRAFVTVWLPHAEPVAASALGTTLADSVRLASEEVRAIAAKADLGSARISLEIPVRTASSEVDLDRPRAFGRYGEIVSRDVAKVGFALPSEAFTRHLLGDSEDDPARDEAALDALLSRRLGEPIEDKPRTRFTTIAVVEDSTRARAMTLVRGRLPRLDPTTVDVALLRRRLAIASAFLARRVHENGRFTYIYDAARDADPDDDYNDIRHAGATGSLFSAYAELRDPTLLAAGERALGWLGGRLKLVAEDSSAAYLPDDDNPMGTIGGTALALIAFATHASVTGERTHLPRLRAMGSFLRRQLDEKGHFQGYCAPNAPAVAQHDVLYFPGEAMLALLRLHAVDPDPKWLEAAERAARWRLATPYESARDRVRDYWFSLSLVELYRLTKSEDFSRRLFEIADGAMAEQDEDEATLRREQGSFEWMPRANPTSTMLEALASDVPLARALGKPTAAIDAILEHGRRAVSFALWQQYDEESAYVARDPAQALGGFHGNPWGANVRIDDNQHAMMALLALMKALAPPKTP